MYIFIFGNLIFLGVIVSGEPENFTSEKTSCPSECICETAPLRTAPFVLNWMTSWGEDRLPEVHKNDILNPALMVSSGTAKDANVDVNKIGLHVTCSLHSTTNTTKLLSSISPKAMVLNLLQAPGCNFTIIDDGQFINLNSLIGLHIQGYAYKDKKQVSGFTPNKVAEVIHQQQIFKSGIQDKPDNIRELTLALAEDALKSLVDLQLIDLQYVTLVASKNIRRLRRYSMDPITSKILLDLPLPTFLKVAKGIDDFRLPPYFDTYDNFHTYDNDDNTIESNIFPIETNFGSIIDRTDDIREELIGEIYEKENMLSNYINSKDKKLLPYMMFRANFKRKLSPFSTLKNLKYLRIAHAKLDKIGPELFDGIHKLNTLTLEHNNIQVIPEDIFNPVPALRHLSLAHNKILSAEFIYLKGLLQLLTVDLDFNRIPIIGTTSFPILPSLKTIRAFGNPITQIFPDAFILVNKTENLYLGSTTESMDIHEDSFRALPLLNTLLLQNVSKSNLKRNLFSGIAEIKYLTMHGQVTEIDFDAFSKISLLKELDLSYCTLEKLSMDAFFGLYNLKRLDLSHNKLTELVPGTFDYLTNLKELYINHNRLTTLPLGIFLPIPAKLIRLEKNPWDCTCDLLQLRPSITNKVKRPGPVVCRWSDKLATVCKKTRSRLAYDARVAPLCATPKNLIGNDVYHAALRHLKCSKSHWDPKLLVINLSTVKKLKHLKSTEKQKLLTVNGTADIKNWIPLYDHTPVPVRKKDLFDIAEMEDLDEVIENPVNNSNNSANILFSNSSPQNDDPKTIINRISRYISPVYIHDRKLIKLAALKKMVKQREIGKQAIKKEHKHKMYQKAKLKAYIKSKQQEYHNNEKKNLKNYF